MQRLSLKWIAAGLLLGGCLALTQRASAQNLPVLKYEHTDVNMAYSGGANGVWNLTARDDDNQTYYASNGVVLFVADPEAKIARPNGSAWDFLGVPAGSSIWRLPESQNPDLLYLGFAAYDTPAGTFDSYSANVESGGRVAGTGRWVRLTLLEVCGPGNFGLWKNTSSGPNLFMANADGITESDSLWIPQGGHGHFSVAFTQTGIYKIKFKASGFVGGRKVESPPFAYYFGVGTESINVALGGAIALQNAVHLAQELNFLFRPMEQGAAEISKTVTLDAEGRFNLPDDIPIGKYVLHLSGRKWLSRNVTVDLCPGPITDLTALLLPGDIAQNPERDGVIDLFDLVTLFDSYGATPADPEWNELADLNCDGENIDLFDLVALFDAYGEEGDP